MQQMSETLPLKKLMTFALNVSACLGITLISAAAELGMAQDTAVSPAQLILSALMLAVWGVFEYLAFRKRRCDILIFHTAFWCFAILGYLILCISSGQNAELGSGMRIFTAILGIPVSGYFSLIAALGIEKRLGCIVMTLLPAVIFAAVGIFLILRAAADPMPAACPEEPSTDDRHGKRKKRKRRKNHGR